MFQHVLVRGDPDGPIIVVHRANLHGYEKGAGTQSAAQQPALYLD